MKHHTNHLTRAVRNIIRKTQQYLGLGGGEKPVVLQPTSRAKITKSAYVSVIIPKLHGLQRSAELIRSTLADPATYEVIVVDDRSDREAISVARKAGATVVLRNPAESRTSLREGIAASKKDWVVCLDGNFTQFRRGIITALCTPLVRAQADFVRARLDDGQTQEDATIPLPLVDTCFPELPMWAQPLSGMVASRKSLLHTLAIAEGYGMDIGLLLDSRAAKIRLTEVDISAFSTAHRPQQVA